MRRRRHLIERYSLPQLRFAEPIRRFGQSLSVQVFLPLPLALKARKEIYAYPFPRQRQLVSKVIRHDLRYSRLVPWVKTRVRIRLPRTLPLSRRSYVSLRRAKLNIHSARQVARLLEPSLYVGARPWLSTGGELNRRRYVEGKGNVRKAHHGQLDSPGALRHGLVAFAQERGLGMPQLADAALVARAMR